MLIFSFHKHILIKVQITGGELVSTVKDELVRQPSCDVITCLINGKTYHINRAPAMMACAAC